MWLEVERLSKHKSKGLKSQKAMAQPLAIWKLNFWNSDIENI